MNRMNEIEKYFKQYRDNIIGVDAKYDRGYGTVNLVYLDWIASGRLYYPIEKKIFKDFGKFCANTHSESSESGEIMTLAYHKAQQIIKKHCNASKDDVIIATGGGMTTVVNKFQRILGLTCPEQLKGFLNLPEELRPVVFITHMEHHSNHTSWLETLADVIVLNPNKEGLVDLNQLENQLEKHKNRKLKIGAFTACSNVTGIKTPYHEMAKIMHNHGGYCFVDFAASAPYVKIDMHPKEDPQKSLDAILFSPHKFLGGPGSPGILIFNSKLYERKVPDQPGGGTVEWTNPWGQHKFVSNIEAREDGGTPMFLQTIKAALAINLKEQMNVDMIEIREKELVSLAFDELGKIDKLHILAYNVQDRIGAISFYIDNIHYNLIVKLLSDRFGIQVRGGCSCAGTYGHYLLNVSPELSRRITSKIDQGDYSEKPGWIRLSLHPTTTNDEIYYFIDAIKMIIKNIDKWEKDYFYFSNKNEYVNIKHKYDKEKEIESLFEIF